MMILDLEQRSPEWHRARAPLPTAGDSDKLITSKGAPSKQYSKYLNKKLAARMGALPRGGSFMSEAMQQGVDMEDEAIAWYELMVAEVDRVGFCLRDDHLAGCSPDALVTGQRRGLEIKCPQPETHVQYLRDQKLPTAYVSQVQFSMWVCDYPEWDFLSYCPGLPELLIHVKRDDAFCAALQLIVVGFNNEMDTVYDRLMAA